MIVKFTTAIVSEIFLGLNSPQLILVGKQLLSTTFYCSGYFLPTLLLHILGVNINWQTLEKNSGGKKISLPTYPFQRATYWLE